jgi:hypothetical protein
MGQRSQYWGVWWVKGHSVGECGRSKVSIGVVVGRISVSGCSFGSTVSVGECDRSTVSGGVSGGSKVSELGSVVGQRSVSWGVWWVKGQ